MPIWEDDDTGGASVQAPSFSQRVRAGNAVPILSDSALLDLALFGQAPFAQFYAGRVGYPFAAASDIALIANYDRHTNQTSDTDCKSFYLDCLKNFLYRQAKAANLDAGALADAREQADRLSVSAFAARLGYPSFGQGAAYPLLVLANLPFKIYLTTSPHTFLEDALRQARQTEPLTKMCRWRGPIEAPEKDLWTIPGEYRPSQAQPLVYHLFGLDAYPDSLVLTEDDHLEFLVNIALGRGDDKADRLPALVRGALFDDVILLGFGLDRWAFRALYYGLLRSIGQEKDRRGLCAVQLSSDERAKQEKYLQGYLDRDAKFNIFWGDLGQYAEELMRG